MATACFEHYHLNYYGLWNTTILWGYWRYSLRTSTNAFLATHTSTCTSDWLKNCYNYMYVQKGSAIKWGTNVQIIASVTSIQMPIYYVTNTPSEIFHSLGGHSSTKQKLSSLPRGTQLVDYPSYPEAFTHLDLQYIAGQLILQFSSVYRDWLSCFGYSKYPTIWWLYWNSPINHLVPSCIFRNCKTKFVKAQNVYTPIPWHGIRKL